MSRKKTNDKMDQIIDKTTYIAKTAVIIGEVKIGKNCGVFPNAVIRGDQNTIVIDDGTNIQDCCIIHTDKEHDVKIGKNVSIGHGAIIHGATLGDDSLIGMNVTVLNGAEIGSGCIIGANSLIKTNMKIPNNSMVVGVPGKVIKTDAKYREIAIKNAITYIEISKNHLKGKYELYKK
jgi:carbonic anhydrase/acetyltransferase-like protein (isoleucine patch superfamily)